MVLAQGDPQLLADREGEEASAGADNSDQRGVVSVATPLAFFAAGVVVPQGSMKAFVAGGKAVVTHRDSGSLQHWRTAIATEARQALRGRGRDALVGTIRCSIVFRRQRPMSHYMRDGIRLKPSAPAFWDCPTTPDIDKLARAVLDALTGVVYADDKQVAALSLVRQWAGPDVGPAGAMVVVGGMDGGLEDLF